MTTSILRASLRAMTSPLPRPQISGAPYDYVVVGAGSAGCAVAARLAEDPKKRVLLVEAGMQDWNPWIHIPVGYFQVVHSRFWDWKYRCEGATSGLNGRSIAWPRGKVLGGSSCLNGLLYIRGQPQDFDDWANLNNPGWDWDSVLPYFRKAEDNVLGLGEFVTHHGVGGPCQVSNSRYSSPVADAWKEACSDQLGIPQLLDMNGEEVEGVGYFQQITSADGLRCSSAVAYLHRNRPNRPNLEIATSRHVARILLDTSGTTPRATGVELADGTQATVVPGGEVVLSAGAMGSPHLLQLSGVGPGGMLARAGVPVVKDLPGVGGNLQDHLQLRPKFRVNQETLNDQVGSWIGQIKIGLEYMAYRTGPMTMAASAVCAFARCVDETRPDVQFHFQPLSTSGTPAVTTDPYSAFTASICQLRPESRGHLELVSRDPSVHPKVHANYLSTELDCKVAVESIKLARKVSEGSALSPLEPTEEAPGKQVQTDAEILEWVRNNAETIYHPVGTAKMGPASDPEAVVDHELRVHGIAGLRVADASIMPIITSGNTHAPAVMIGEKAADMIKAAAAS